MLPEARDQYLRQRVRIAASTDTTWVADNFYGVPWRQTPLDFGTVESLRMIYPPELGAQEYACVFDDSRHPRPQGFRITQRSFVSANPAHKDFAVLEYRVHNTDTVPVVSVYDDSASEIDTSVDVVVAGVCDEEFASDFGVRPMPDCLTV